jgi:methylated-DNA-[protein]-cysteine S-methyltransferase
MTTARTDRAAAPLALVFDRVPSPIGEVIVAADAQGRLRAVDWADHESRMRRLLRMQYGPDGVTLTRKRDPHGLTKAMRAYFRGQIDAIDPLPVAFAGTDFQNAVWRALRRIPAGGTRAYAEMARLIRKPSAIRAVGAANGANPVSVVVPCHRLVGSDGSLTGYGGGMRRKRWLLEHEGAL